MASGRQRMDNPSKQQNYAEIHYETPTGTELMEPIKIFRIIGELYRVATPILGGYVLVQRPKQLKFVMDEKSKVITLAYAPISTLRVFDGLDDIIGHEVKLINSDQSADKVKPVQLAPVSGSHYFLINGSNVGPQIQNPDSYVPEHPAEPTEIMSMSQDDLENWGDVQAARLADTQNEVTANMSQSDNAEEKLRVQQDDSQHETQKMTTDSKINVVKSQQSQQNNDRKISQSELSKQIVNQTERNSSVNDVTIPITPGANQAIKQMTAAITALAQEVAELSVMPGQHQEQIDKLLKASQQLLETIRLLTN